MAKQVLAVHANVAHIIVALLIAAVGFGFGEPALQLRSVQDLGYAILAVRPGDRAFLTVKTAGTRDDIKELPLMGREE